MLTTKESGQQRYAKKPTILQKNQFDRVPLSPISMRDKLNCTATTTHTFPTWSLSSFACKGVDPLFSHSVISVKFTTREYDSSTVYLLPQSLQRPFYYSINLQVCFIVPLVIQITGSRFRQDTNKKTNHHHDRESFSQFLECLALYISLQKKRNLQEFKCIYLKIRKTTRPNISQFPSLPSSF